MWAAAKRSHPPAVMNILGKLSAGHVSCSPEETETLAQALATVFPPDTTLALHGDLGTGKTTLVRGMARAWGITKPITSPTYNILSIYRGTRTLLHLDAYRLENERQFDALMLEDFLQRPYCLAVEWPENLGQRLSNPCWHIELAIVAENRHRITLLSADGGGP